MDCSLRKQFMNILFFGKLINGVTLDKAFTSLLVFFLIPSKYFKGRNFHDFWTFSPKFILNFQSLFLRKEKSLNHQKVDLICRALSELLFFS